MPDKLTDKEIVKALEEILEIMLVMGDLQKSSTISKAIKLINRLQVRVEKLEKVEHFADKTIATLQAENERLKNAYKQVAWERDIFAEDMKEEIKKDCSYLMLDIKTIKAEAYKEFANWQEVKLANNPNISMVAFQSIIKTNDNLLKETVGEDK